jgi:hypothetical protein
MTLPIIETIQISPGPNGSTAKATYHYDGPVPAPDHGSEWDQSLDAHRVSVILELPGTDWKRPSWLIVDSEIFGTRTYELRGFKHSVTAPSVREAYNVLQRAVAEAVEPLRTHVEARNARLLQRNRALQAGRIDSPFTHTD